MFEHSPSLRRLRIVSLVEAAIIAFLFGVVLYLIQFARSQAVVTITPNATTPNSTSTPTQRPYGLPTDQRI